MDKQLSINGAPLTADLAVQDVAAVQAAIKDAQDVLRQAIEKHVHQLVDPLPVSWLKSDWAVQRLLESLLELGKGVSVTERQQVQDVDLNELYLNLLEFNGSATSYITLLIRLDIETLGIKGPNDSLCLWIIENDKIAEFLAEDEEESQ